MPDLVKRSVRSEDLTQSEVPAAFRKLSDAFIELRGAWNRFAAGFTGESALAVYPVGTVYTTVDLAFDPNTTFGGTWTEGAAGVWTRTV